MLCDHVLPIKLQTIFLMRLSSFCEQNVEASVSLGKGHKRKAAGAGQPSKAVTIGSNPILYTQTASAGEDVQTDRKSAV